MQFGINAKHSFKGDAPFCWYTELLLLRGGKFAKAAVLIKAQSEFVARR